MTGNERHIGRREVLRGAAGVALGSAVVGSASASHEGDVWQTHKPDHVSVYYEDRLSLIETYQPYLRTANLDVSPEAQYAAYFESSEYDTDAICYWLYLPTQQGLTSWDSHYTDREPIVVFVDENGLDHVNYTGWHYIVARSYTPQTKSDNGQNVHYTVSNPYHHYYTEPDGSDTGVYVELNDFTAVVSDWFTNGWGADADVVMYPWLTNTRESWWPHDSWSGVSWTEERAQLSLRVARIDPWSTVYSDL